MARAQSTRHQLRDKGSSLRKRIVNTRELRPRILIVCGGTHTEPNYFRSFRVNIDVRIVGRGRDPRGLIDYAQRLLEQETYTQVWLVFDRDDIDPSTFNDAIARAQRLKMRVAYSNEAFEVWYILHFDCKIPPSRQRYGDVLTAMMGKTYRKNDFAIYATLQSRQSLAIARAKRLLAQYRPHDPANDNPCTTVHLLVEELNRYLS